MLFLSLQGSWRPSGRGGVRIPDDSVRFPDAACRCFDWFPSDVSLLAPGTPDAPALAAPLGGDHRNGHPMTRPTMTRWRALLLAAGAAGLLGAGVAHAQAGATYDPAQLPEIKGVVAQYDLTPRGDVDGVILQDGTEVHLPPHLSSELAAAVRPGGAVTIHGLRARALPLVQAASITDDASGRTVTDTGPGPGAGPGAHPPGPPPGPPWPHNPRDEGQALDAQGTVRMLLHGPRGDFNGVLLDSGAMIHLPPPEAARLAADLAVGRPVAAEGFGVRNSLGESIAARRIGASRDTMAQVAAPPPGGPGRPPHGPAPDAPPQRP